MFNLNNFKINNIYYYLFGFLGIVTILILLYFWRRISNLLNSNDNLEKKNSLLKKELKNLKDNNDESSKSNSTEMNQIFGNDSQNSDIDIVMENNMQPTMMSNELTENEMMQHQMMQNNMQPTMMPNEMTEHEMMQQEMMQQQMMQHQMMKQQMMQQQMMQQQMMNKEDQIIESDKNETTIENNDEIEDIVDKIIKPNNEELSESSKPVKPVNLSVKKDNDDNSSIVSDQNTITSTYTKYKLNKLTVDKLKEICINNGGSDEGTKVVLIDRILSEQYK